MNHKEDLKVKNRISYRKVEMPSLLLATSVELESFITLQNCHPKIFANSHFLLNQ